MSERHASAPAIEGCPERGAGARITVVCAGGGLDGSVARVALAQAGQLASAFEVSLLSESFPAHLEPGVRAVPLAARRFDYLRRLCHVPNALAFAAAVKSGLLALHRSSPLDLMLCHDLALAGLLAPGLKRQLGLRLAVCGHEDIDRRPRGTYGLLHTLLHRWATPRAYRVADAVLAISPYMAARARAYGVADDRITLTPSGLEPVEIGLGPGAPEESGSDASKAPLRLLYAGRLAVEKGVVVLLAACQLLRDRGTRYSLELIGDGTLRPALERRARELGVSDRVRFLGSVPRQQLGAHYRRADLVCMPSLDEPFGAVAVEALMAGTPVVASEVGGLPFVVRHGENGLLVPPDEPATLAGALALLDQDRTRLASLRRAAHASVRSRFSWDHLGETVRGAVRAALAAPRTGPEGAAAPRRALADGS